MTHKEHLAFTEAKLARLVPNAEQLESNKERCIWDSETSGLGIRISPKGVKTLIWYRSLNGRPERVTIGRYPDVTLKDARQRAELLNAERSKGNSPSAVKQQERKEMSLGELCTEYIEQHAKTRCTHWKDVEANLRRNFGDWFGHKLGTFSRYDVQTHINRLGKEKGVHVANRSLDDLKAVYNWAIRQNLFPGPNPCLGVTKFKVQSRERILQPHEYAALLQCITQEKDDRMRDFVLLALYTGMRKTNVLEMKWQHIDFELGTWYIPRTKNGDPQTVTLIEPALNILRARWEAREKSKTKSEWVLPGDGKTGHLAQPKGGWRRMLESAGLKKKDQKGKSVERLRIHDLRRTMGSYMAMVGVNSPIIGKALGHKSLAAASRYQRVNFDPVRQGMEDAYAYMQEVAGLKKTGTDNLVNITPAKS